MTLEHDDLLRAGWHLVCRQAWAAAKDHGRPPSQLAVWLLDLRGQVSREIATWVVTPASVRRRVTRNDMAAPIPFAIGVPVEMAIEALRELLPDMIEDVLARPANTIVVVLVAHNDEPLLLCKPVSSLRRA